MINLREDVVAFVDDLIDGGKCGGHDVGLEVLTGVLSEELGVSVAVEHGAKAILECLEDWGLMGEEYLRAAALHFLLDCVDRVMKAFGTQVGRERPGELLRYCTDLLESRWRVQLYRYFPLEAAEVERYVDALVGRVRFLAENYGRVLEECVGYIAEENEAKGVGRVGHGVYSQLLSQLCRKLGIKCIFYVDGRPLPVAAAARKVYSKLERGEEVEISSTYGKVRVTARSPGELLEKLTHLLKEEPGEAVRVEDVDARWRDLKRRAIRWAEERSAHVSPGATVVAYRRMPYVPERVAAFYRALDVMLESAKPTVLELLRSCRESEAEELLRGIAVRMFSNPLIVTFPPFAAPAGEGRVALSPETVAGLAKVCESAGVRVEPRVEWSREELLRLLDEVYGRVSAYEKGWVDVLRKMVEG